jgi:tetratricopeptide (TPR) repeat protein/DNA-binding XRE family transcriptional regulator
MSDRLPGPSKGSRSESTSAFAALVRTLRESAGQTQVAFAERLNVSRSLIGNIETGVRPSREFVELLVRSFPDRRDSIVSTFDGLEQRRTTKPAGRRAETPVQRDVTFLMSSGRHREAHTAMLRELQRPQPRLERVWLNERLAEVHFILSESEAGIKALGDAIDACRDATSSSEDLGDKEIELREMLASRLQHRDDFVAAHAILDGGLVEAPDAGALWHRKGIVHWYEHAYSDAYASIMTAVKCGVPLSRVLHARGQLLAEWGNPRAAIEDLTGVLEDEYAESLAAYARSTRAHAIAQLGDFERALLEWNIAEKATPDNGWLHYFRALANYHRGSYAEALQGLQRALACSSPHLNLPKRIRAESILRELEDWRASKG